ncbi:MAG TPA: outer membrane beta-barrel protein [Longimicrobiales bacterium]|nr:outer membrane beta-barrel protein [Longimicrobiales bacterium]
MRRTGNALFAVLILLCAANTAHAQLPIHFSANAGIAAPFSNEKDVYKNGYHVGVGAKLMLVPLEFNASLDHMGENGKFANQKDLNIASVGATIPISITPGLLPVGLYFIAGGGVYKHSASTTTGGELKGTDFGANGGAGVRVGIPGIASIFAEGRGVAIFATGNKLTYITAAVGIRF